MPQQHGPTTSLPDNRNSCLLSKESFCSISQRYNTTPTAALQVIEGLMPLHIKAKMQSTMVRVGRPGRNCDYEGIHFDHESYEQPSPPSTIHPTLFSLEDDWNLSHMGDKFLPIERQLKCTQMAQR
ncbi:hypothetical protein AVEN_177328-1 [Araneus ventricosus]|uniref:Uncharacterized protein n=1 Tax=Araneus ventricosus TaxID=182803 RepID=A0A4Y2C4L9_ARAVE|nr:hypothetical protein AVEN_177328-1 [Araneus ventricosus]